MQRDAMPKHLRIALITSAEPEIGGGRSYEALMIAQLLSLKESEYSFIIFVPERDLKRVRNMTGRRTYRAGRLSQALQIARLNPLVFRLSEVFGLSMSHLEKQLLKNEVDLAFFLSPSVYAAGISRIPVISTIWDIAHTLDPEFPEVTARRRNEFRDLIYRQTSRKSIALVVESERGRNDVCRAYGLPENRVVVIPFEAIVESWGEPSNPPGDYVLYPAQLWPHKNHAVLVLALGTLKNKGIRAPRLVFTGSDKGNQGYIDELARSLGVRESIEFTGFVPDQTLRELMLSARGLVMPTFFGPTNLPPIEALKSGIPVAISTRDSLADYADGTSIIAIDPADVDGWADALERMENLDVARPARFPSVKGSQRPLGEILVPVLTSFAERRRTWAGGDHIW